MVIEINKDIDRYQESVAMGLTARQLIFGLSTLFQTNFFRLFFRYCTGV